MEKSIENTKITEVFEHIYRFRILIHDVKTIILLQKLWYYGKNYGTLIYYGKKLWHYGKNYGTIQNYSLPKYFFVRVG